VTATVLVRRNMGAYLARVPFDVDVEGSTKGDFVTDRGTLGHVVALESV
jgi:hypothetical protein